MILAVWNVLVQLAPWMFVGMLFAGLLHVLLPEGLIRRKLRGRSGVVKAVALGVPLPLCSCGVVPAGLGLKKDGASNGAVVGFLISTPQTGVDSILISASFLGWPFALFKLISAAITGVLGGFFVDAFSGGSDASNEAGDITASRGKTRGIRAMFAHAIDILRSIWGWLLFGVIVSAAIETLLPGRLLISVAQWGVVPASLLALLISLPLYVCAIASVPIAAALVSGGLPAGAALVFLMAGPATNIATMGAIYRRLGGAVLAMYLGTIIVGSVALAWMFQWLIAGSNGSNVMHHHDHLTWWRQASAALLLVLFCWFAMDDLRRWLRRGKSGAEGGGEIRIPVSGMTCNRCVSRLENALSKTDRVDSAVVHLEPGEAIIRGTIDEDRLRQVIQDTGFDVKQEEIECPT